MIMAVFVLLSIVLILVVIFDFFYFIIPNSLSIFILGTFLIYFLLTDYSRIPYNLIFPTIIFFTGILLAQSNILGFGDSKLLSSLSFGIGPFYTLHLIIYTVLLGGILAVLILAFKKHVHAIRLKAFQNNVFNKLSYFFIADLIAVKKEVSHIAMQKYMPYGLAIAPAGLYAVYLSFVLKG